MKRKMNWLFGSTLFVVGTFSLGLILDVENREIRAEPGSLPTQAAFTSFDFFYEVNSGANIGAAVDGRLWLHLAGRSGGVHGWLITSDDIFRVSGDVNAIEDGLFDIAVTFKTGDGIEVLGTGEVATVDHPDGTTTLFGTGIGFGPDDSDVGEWDFVSGDVSDSLDAVRAGGGNWSTAGFVVRGDTPTLTTEAPGN